LWHLADMPAACRLMSALGGEADETRDNPTISSGMAGVRPMLRFPLSQIGTSAMPQVFHMAWMTITSELSRASWLG